MHIPDCHKKTFKMRKLLYGTFSNRLHSLEYLDNFVIVTFLL